MSAQQLALAFMGVVGFIGGYTLGRSNGFHAGFMEAMRRVNEINDSARKELHGPRH